MPGRPILNKLIADVEAAGGDVAIHARIAGGETIGKIAETFGISRPFLSGYINRTPELKAEVERARRARADAYAEQALELADAVAPNPNDIAKVRERIGVRKWLAGIDDPDKYGPKQAGVQINVGTLHLDALRKVSAELAAPGVIEGTAQEVSDV